MRHVRLEGAGGLRRLLRRLGLNPLAGMVVSMSDVGFFGTGFCMGLGVATLVVGACWGNGNDAVTGRWICFLLGIAAAGVFAGWASSCSDGEKK